MSYEIHISRRQEAMTTTLMVEISFDRALLNTTYFDSKVEKKKKVIGSPHEKRYDISFFVWYGFVTVTASQFSFLWMLSHTQKPKSKPIIVGFDYNSEMEKVIFLSPTNHNRWIKYNWKFSLRKIITEKLYMDMTKHTDSIMAYFRIIGLLTMWVLLGYVVWSRWWWCWWW